MFKRKPSRSREFRKNNEVIDMEEARKARKEKREQKRLEEEERIRIEEEKKVSKRKKRQRRNRAIVYFVAILFIVALLLYSAWGIFSLQIEKNRLEKENANLQQQRESLQNELDSVNDPEYIEQQARYQLKLIKPGETLYVIPKLPPLEDAEAAGLEEDEQEDADPALEDSTENEN